MTVGVSRHAVPLAYRTITCPEVALDPVGPAERFIELDQSAPFTLAYGGVPGFREGFGRFGFCVSAGETNAVSSKSAIRNCLNSVNPPTSSS